MTWEEKLAALQNLGNTSLRMRSPGDWYVSSCVEIKQGGLLSGDYGNGTTPEAAVGDHWRKLVDDLPNDQYLVVNAMGPNRRAYRWGGYMWQEVREG